MTVGFVVPYEEVFESAITTALAAGGEDSLGNKITEAYDYIPSGAINFKNNITGFELKGSNPNNEGVFEIDGGSGDKATANLTLNYAFGAGSGVDLNHRYIYCDLHDEGVTTNKPFYSGMTDDKGKVKDMTVLDKSWTKDNGLVIDPVTEDIAGFYSISTDGLIVIKLTENYIKNRINGGSFEGAVECNGFIGRDSTASGDREISFGNNKIKVTFDDVIKNDSKQSRIATNDNGDMVIHYTITVKNPARNVDFTKYNFTDSILNPANAGKISNVTSNHSDCISYDNNGTISFTDKAKEQSEFTIEYDYKPTPEEMSSGKITNNAKIENKTNPNDKAETSKETEISPSEFKANIVKNGKASYLINDGETGYIQWEINVTRKYNLSLKNYFVTDDAFSKTNDAVEGSAHKKTEIVSVKDKNGNDVAYTINGDKITINGDTDNVTIVYRTYVDNSGNSLAGKTNSEPVSNNVKVTPPGGTTPDDEKTPTASYSEHSSVEKTGNNKNINGYDKLNKPESEEVVLDWTVEISDFSGIHKDRPYTDTLGDTDRQWLTQDQINSISIAELTKGTDYEVVSTTGENGKITGFTINFKNDNPNKKKLTITYQSTVETKDIANNSSYTFKNTGTYDNTPDEGTVTVTRGNSDSHTSGIKKFETNKSWVGFPNDYKEDVWVKLQYRLENESTDSWHDYPVIAGEVNENPKKLGSYTTDWGSTAYNWQVIWNNLPQKYDDKVYYYRVIEVDANGNEITSATYTTSYYVESWRNIDFDNNAGYSAIGEAGQLNVINTYNNFDATVSKSWQNAPANHPTTVEFKLYKTTTPEDNNSWTEVTGVTPTQNGDSYTFSNLPRMDGDKVVYYKVVETPITDYTTTYPDNFISKDNTSWTVTNTYDKMAINAKKNWVGDEGSKENRNGLQITFKLQYTTNANPNANDDSIWHDIPAEWGIADTTKTLTGSASVDTLSHTWDKLPRKDASGNTIHYRVRESQPAGSEYEPDYKTEVVTPSSSYDADYIINNVWQYANITPQKKWSGDSPADRPASITVKLQYRRKDSNGNWIEGWQDSTESSDTTISSAGTKTINVDKSANNNDNIDTASSSWERLPRTDENKNTYYYRAVEANIPTGYIETSKDDENILNKTGNSVITNTLNTIEITPAKKWVGDKDFERNRYDVEFKLQWKYEGESAWREATAGSVVGERNHITISKQSGSDDWTTSEKWEKLPKTVDGKTIYYQVVEVTENDKYTKGLSDSVNTGGTLTVTNTYKFIKITASKDWASDSPSDRPEKITVHLEQSTNTNDSNSWETVDGSEQDFEVNGDTMTLTHESWDNLPKKDKDGKTIYYRVVESSVRGYGATYSPEYISSDSNSREIAITNTKREGYSKTAIELSKDISNTIKDGAETSSLKEITSISKDKLKDVPTDSSGDYYIFAYKVGIPKGGNVEYIDTLPTDASFYKYNNQLYAYYDQGNNTYKMYANNDVSYDDTNGNEIKFTIGSGGSAPNVCGFVYFIKVPKETVDNAVNTTGRYELSNNIKRVGDDDEGVTAELIIGSNTDSPDNKENIKKSYQHISSDETFARARYSIEINPDSKKLSNEDYLDISDIFKVTGYNEPGCTEWTPEKKHTGDGLLDATINEILVEDMDNLDANGNPTKITDYVYIPEYNKTTTTPTTNNYTFEKFSSDALKWRSAVKPGEEITLTITGPAGTTHENWAGAFYFKDSTGVINIAELPTPSFTIGTDGTATIKVTVPTTTKEGKKIGMVEFNFYGSGSVKANTITGVTGVANGVETSFDSAAMSFRVPDEKHLKITYYYSLTVNGNTPGTGLTIGDTPPEDSEVFFKNEASINTSDGKETSETDETHFVIQHSGATITAGNTPSIEKVDIGNYAINNLNATFKLAKYNKETQEWIYATEFTSDKNGITQISYGEGNAKEAGGVVPSGADNLVIEGTQKIDLASNVLYKLVEVDSPTDKGYLETPYKKNQNINVNSDAMNGFVFYFVFNGKPSEFSSAVAASKIMQVSNGGTIAIPNVNLIDISVSKTWAQLPANTSGVKSTFKLYYSETRSSTIPTGDKLRQVSELGINNAEKEATFTMDNGSLKQSVVEWKDLPNGKNGKPIYYYVKETSYTIDNKTYVLQDDGTYKASDGTTGEYKSLYSGNALNQDGEIKVTNTKGLYVQKEWKNSDGSNMTTAPVNEIKFKLQGKTAGGKWKDINLADTERTLNSTNKWQIPISVDKLTGYVDFKVIEEQTQEQREGALYGYVISYTRNLNGTSGVLNIINKNPHTTTTNFIVKKEWADGLSEHDGIEVKLYRATTAWAGYTPTAAEKTASTVVPYIDENKVEHDTVTLNADNDWSAKWEGLKNLQENGKPYYYYAVETVPTGYTATYAKGGTNSVQTETITNTPEEVVGKLSVQKNWEKVSNKEEITLSLYRRKKASATNQYNIPSDITVSCTGDSITQGTQNNNTNTTYPKELAGLLGLTYGSWGGDGVQLVNNGQDNRLIDALITNHNIGLNYNTDAKVVCLIIGTNNILGNETPDAAKDKLKTYIDSIKGGNRVIFVGSIPYLKNAAGTSGENQMNGKDDTVYNANVKSYNDKVKALVESYNSKDIIYVDINSVVDKETMLADGIHPNPTGYTAIANKFYEAIGNYYGKKATTVGTSDVATDIDNVPTDLTEAEKVNTFTLRSSDDPANNWKKSFENLPTSVTEDGVTYQYIYYVKEETTSNNWDVTYQHNGQPANGQMAITVTNTGDDDVAKLPIKVQKVWKVGNTDVTADATKHPDSVEVQLYSSSSANGPFTTKVGNPVTLSAPDWSHEWEVEEGLYYKVVETEVNGWKATSDDVKQITTDSTKENPTTITVTNAPELGNLQVEKSWLGEANADSVQVELYRVAVGENVASISETPETTTYNFSSEDSLYSLSRLNRAIAELETQESEQETPQAETEETTKSSGSLSKVKSNASAQTASTPYVSLAINLSSGDGCFDIPDLSGKTITKVSAIITAENSNYIQFWFNFYNDGSEWSGNTSYTIYSSGENELDSKCSEYNKLRIQVQGNQANAELTEIRFYYAPQGPDISFEKPTGNTAVVGDTVTLNPTVSEGATVTYSIVEGADKANVDTNGKVTFTGNGTVKIRATAKDSANLTKDATITYTVSAFEITKKPQSITEGDEIQISEFSTNTNGEVEWSSLNTDVLTYANGTFKAVGSGDVTIKATRKGTNVTAEITYTVDAKGFTLSADKTTLHVGGTAQLTASESGITWTSSDSTIATVDNNGLVRAVGNGTATITASRSGKEKKITITVAPFTVNYGSKTHIASSSNEPMNIKETMKVTFNNAIGNVTATSSDEKVATVEVNGDSATITIGTQDKKPATITFTDSDKGTVTITINVNEISEVEANVPDNAEQIKTVGTNGVITISKSNDWKSAEIKDLPLTDEKGNYYQYYIKEVDSDKYIPISYDDGKTLEADKTTTLELTNKPNETSGGIELPETGGMGTKPYTTVGLSLMAMSAAIMYIRRRKRKNA